MVEIQKMYWMWSIPAPGRTHANSAGKDCPQTFHAGRALDEPKRAKRPNANGAIIMPAARRIRRVRTKPRNTAWMIGIVELSTEFSNSGINFAGILPVPRYSYFWRCGGFRLLRL